MHQLKEQYSVSRMAEVFQVSESGYYKWLVRLSGQVLSARGQENQRLAKEIRRIFEESKGSFGSRKITRIVNKKKKTNVNHKRVERLMQEQGLFSKTKKRYVLTTNSNHDFPIAPNLLNRDFTADRPRTKLVSDTTEIQTNEGKFYVAVILDLFGRYPVGMAMSLYNNSELVCAALTDMTKRYDDLEHCLIHSDRGSTYASYDYQQLLQKNGMIPSMSRTGDCWDNAPMESFFGKMKTEWLDQRFQTIVEAKRTVYEYVWYFYPKLRPHASNNYLTPLEYYSQYDYSCAI